MAAVALETPFTPSNDAVVTTYTDIKQESFVK